MKNKFSSFLICKLDKVLPILEDNYYTIETIETSPPNKNEGKGIKRVINIKEINQSEIKVFWSYEKYN